ncbi:hypothetical protein [Candidatus Amarolinea dominans]|uniref:hypothetical protein n=1 Tax=Candidatus Amarolinea dominans TaxID=3140696 RepID=UPI0031CC6D81
MAAILDEDGIAGLRLFGQAMPGGRDGLAGGLLVDEQNGVAFFEAEAAGQQLTHRECHFRSLPDWAETARHGDTCQPQYARIGARRPWS